MLICDNFFSLNHCNKQVQRFGVTWFKKNKKKLGHPTVGILAVLLFFGDKAFSYLLLKEKYKYYIYLIKK